MKAYWWIVPLAALATEGVAQERPADPAAAVPSARYESAFSGYVPYREEKLAPWRDVNDEVGRVGGHVGMMRGMAGQSPAPTTPAAGRPADGPSQQPPGQPPARGEPKAPASGGHAGH